MQEALRVTEDLILEPGVHLMPDGISVEADGVTLDGQGSVLVGDGTGSGIRINGRAGVTIRNVGLRDYYFGIVAMACRTLTLSGCRIRGTGEVPANTVFLDVWRPASEAYGAGIVLQDVDASHIEGNDLQHQMNGLLCYDCHKLEVKDNLANYCSGAGFYLSHTGESLFSGNYADFCCRYQPRQDGSGHMGADAAGFVAVRGSCGNRFLGNMARLSGDGFFLAGLSPGGTHAGCDDNLFEGNDGSYSPNIAFEATFSRGNVYVNNKAHYSNYGFWLGFSRQCRLQANQMWGNRQAGVAVENGYGMEVVGNDFQRNGHGILLWSKYVRRFAAAVPENDTSRDWRIEGNRFWQNGKGLRIAANQDHGIRPLPPGTPLAPRPHHHTIVDNGFEDGRVGIELEGVVDTRMERNRFANNLESDYKEL